MLHHKPLRFQFLIIQQKHSRRTPKQLSTFTDGVAHPPQYIFLDLHGTVRNRSFINVGHLIVYDGKETISNVDPSVYDTAFVIKNGQMVMQTDLSLNGHRLRGSIHYINGILNTKNRRTFLLNGCDKIIVENHCMISRIKVLYSKSKARYTPITLNKFNDIGLINILQTIDSTQTTQLQIMNFPLELRSGPLMVQLKSNLKDEELLLLIECVIP